MDEAGTVREQIILSLPQWRSHKIVRAAPIRAVYATEGDNPPGWIVYLDGGPDPDGFPSIYVKPELFSRYMPKPGDYFVVYDDGYESVSPKKAFEEGYSCLEGKPAVGVV